MKIRTLSIACVAVVAVSFAGCTATFRNSGACEQLMRDKLADASSDSLRVSHRGAGIRGSRVVVEGTIEHVQSASEVAASEAEAAQAAAPEDASAARASARARRSARNAAGPHTVKLPAAAECTFDGDTLSAFRWLAPARLAAPSDDDAASDAAAG